MDQIQLYQMLKEWDERLDHPEGADKRALLCDLLLVCHTLLLEEGRGNGQSVPEEGRGLWTARPEEIKPWVRALARRMEKQSPALAGAFQLGRWQEWATGEQVEAVVEQMGQLLRAEGPEASVCLLERILERYPHSMGGGRPFTPKQVAELMVRLLEGKGGLACDPCCGPGGLLLEAGRRLVQCGLEPQLYGREQEEWAWRSGKLLLYLAGFPAELGTGPINALEEDPYQLPKMDLVLGNPPFGTRNRGRQQELLWNDPRYPYGIPPSGSPMAWVEHMLYLLKEGGSMAVLLKTAVLSSQKAGELQIRKALVSCGLVEAILVLPGGMFYGTKIPISLWLLRKEEAGVGKRVLMVDAQSLGQVQGKQVVLNPEGMERIQKAVEAHRRGEWPEEPGFCTGVTGEEILEREGNLDPRQYIRYPREELPSMQELERREQELERKLSALLEEGRARLSAIADGAETERSEAGDGAGT